MITDMANDMKKQQEKSPKPRNTHFLGIDQVNITLPKKIQMKI